MNRPNRLLEKLSYISVILAALLVSGAVVYDRVTVKTTPQITSPLEGKRLALDGIEWNHYHETVVLALSTTCHYCAESAPFYRDLSAMKKRRPDLNIIAVFPQPVPESTKYLTARGIAVNTILSEPLDVVMASGTPTMYLVGRDGSVKQVWEGFLNDERRNAALNQVESFLKG